jgi:ankyrin repeat protein
MSSVSHFDHVYMLKDILDNETDKLRYIEEFYIPEDDYPDESDRITLHYATANESFQIVEKLIQKGASINVKDKYGNSPIFYSVIRDDYQEVLRLFIRNGAKVNFTNNKGQTISDRRKEVIKISEDYHVSLETIRKHLMED